MLMKCPECDLQVSSKANLCPHCGYPITQKQVAFTRPDKPKKNRHMRLPNGFGQITKIKGNLRKPYRAMITVGKTEHGKPICKLLKPDSYFETYQEAYEALIEYNRNPYDLDPGISVKDLYEKWTTEYFAKLKSDSSARTIKAAWAYCYSVYDMRAMDIRARHIKGIMDSIDSTNMQFRVKSLFNLMLDYAVEYEIVDKNYARTFGLDTKINKSTKNHIAFTNEELEKLWANKENIIVQIILIQTYSGWRPQELVKINRTDVDLVNLTMTGGMKSDAGINRTVPIHSCIVEMVKKIKELSDLRGDDMLFCDENSNILTYDKYYKRFLKIMRNLDLNKNHRPHDPRKTFVTLAKNSGVEEFAIKRLIGHAINDITEKIYTERSDDWLKSEIEKIKV